MERARSRSLVIQYIVLYAGTVVGYVDVVGVMCLVRLHVHSAMDSFTVLFPLFVPGLVLVKVSITLRYGVFSIGPLRDDFMSDGVGGDGTGSGFVTLVYVCSFMSSVVFVIIIGCSVGAVVWAFGAWRLIRLFSAVASHSRSLIDVSPFPFYRPFVDCSRFLMALII